MRVVLARDPLILMVAAGAFSLFTVLRGSSTGNIQPFVRSFYRTYQNTSEPKRYWASIGWNTISGFMCLWVAMKTNEQAAIQPLQDCCYDTAKFTYPPHEKLSTCDQLIAMRGKSGDDVASLIEARGYDCRFGGMLFVVLGVRDDCRCRYGGSLIDSRQRMSMASSIAFHHSRPFNHRADNRNTSHSPQLPATE